MRLYLTSSTVVKKTARMINPMEIQRRIEYEEFLLAMII
jgi:hypothetical protein